MASDRTTRDDQRSASFLAWSAKSAPAPLHQFARCLTPYRPTYLNAFKHAMPCHAHAHGSWWPMVAHACAFNGCDSRIRRRARPPPMPYSKVKVKVEIKIIQASCQHHLRYCTCPVQSNTVQYLGSNLANRKLPPPARQNNCAALLLVARCPHAIHWRRATLVMSNRLVLRTPYRIYSTVQYVKSCLVLPCPELPRGLTLVPQG
jgi:hypothetical protein